MNNIRRLIIGFGILVFGAAAAIGIVAAVMELASYASDWPIGIWFMILTIVNVSYWIGYMVEKLGV